jgi:PTH2 family peptidyl-tRNA hydrolase
MSELKQVFLVRSDLRMGKGKAAAQCCHAAIEAYERAKEEWPEWVKAWKMQNQAKVVLRVSSEKELISFYNMLKGKFPSALVRDAGRTQLEPNTATCLAAGPAPADKLDNITGKLKLL